MHPDWSDPAPLLGRLARQAFAVSTVEEVSFRGYLFPQLFLALARRWPGSSGWSLLAALALSQALFALVHLPFLRYVDLSPEDIAAALPVILLYGLLFAGLYLVTRNLFLVVGVHGLVTAPTPLYATPDVTPVLPITEAALLVMGLAGLWSVRVARLAVR